MIRKRAVKHEEKGDSTKDTPKKNEKVKYKSGKGFVKLIFLVAFILYGVIPFTFYACPAVRRHAVFLNYISLSNFKNLSSPIEVGLNCTRNFYVTSENDIKLGVWHIPPYEAQYQCRQLSNDEFKDGRPVFLYVHGNAGTRGGGHRVELYKVLRAKLNAHIVTFDYRGYGDSTNEIPSEEGVVRDTKHVYDWLRKRVDPSRIFIWGHSLGTAVSVSFLDDYASAVPMPAALILEAPFTRIIDAAKHHPLSIFHRYMPFFDFFFANPIGEGPTAFNSVGRIGRLKCPLLILHAEDDGFVPYQLGEELYHRALAARENLEPRATQFIGFDYKLDHGHKNIYMNPNLPDIVTKFMKNLKSENGKIKVET